MRHVVALCLSLALGPLPAWAQVLPIDHAGSWIGGGVQPDGATWEMILTLYPDGAIVDYPGIPCAAYWTLAEVGADTLTATEHLAAGFDLCIDGLDLRAARDAKGTLTVTWIEPDGSPSATAWLAQN